MPVIDGMLNVPVPKWCRGYDAVLWIMLKHPPVAGHHISLVKDHGLSLGFDAEGSVRNNPNYLQSWAKLYYAAIKGKVSLRGRPAIGLQKIVRDLIHPSLHCEKWGDMELIPIAKLEQARGEAFSDVDRGDFLTDGIFYDSKYCPPTAWAYGNIEVNVPQLIKTFHPAESKGLRAGTKVEFIQPEEPQDHSSNENAVTRNRGGRPRSTYRDAVINATWGAIYRGSLLPEKRENVAGYVKRWLTANCKEKVPDDSQIRDIVRGIWDAVIWNDGKSDNV